MNRFKIITVTVLVTLIGFILWRKYYHKLSFPLGPATSRPLGVNEKERIVILPHTLVVTTPNGTISHYIPETATVTIQKDDKVIVTTKSLGLTFHPGLSTFYDNEPRIGADMKLWYWNRLGFSAGVGWGFANNRNPEFAPYLSGLYNVYSNTDLMIGYTAQRNWLFGLRIAL